MPPEIRYDRAVISRKTDELATRMNRSPRNASVLATGSNVRVLKSREGFRLDESATWKELLRALEDLSSEAEVSGRTLEPAITTREPEDAARIVREAVSEPIVLTSGKQRWTKSAAQVGTALIASPSNGKLNVTLDQSRLEEEMSDLVADLSIEPVEAGYGVEESDDSPEVSVTPGREGRSVDREQLYETIEDGLFEGQRQYEVPTTFDRPDLSTSEARRLKPTDLLGSYRTDHSIVRATAPGRKA